MSSSPDGMRINSLIILFTIIPINDNAGLSYFRFHSNLEIITAWILKITNEIILNKIAFSYGREYYPPCDRSAI